MKSLYIFQQLNRLLENVNGQPVAHDRADLASTANHNYQELQHGII